MIKLNAVGDRLILLTNRIVNSGSYGYYTLEFEFDKDWENLLPHIVVIENGVQRADEVIVDNVHKLTTTENGIMMIGVYGLDSEGSKCLSTNCVCLEVEKGAYTGGYSMPKDIWDAYQRVIVGYVERAEEAQAHGPIIGSNGNWYLWDVATKKYKDTGVNASGGSSSGDGANDFIVTADLVDNEDIPTIENVSATFDEIQEAYQKGQNIVLKINYFGHAEVTAPMMSISDAEARFSLAQSIFPYLVELVIKDGEAATLTITRFMTPSEVTEKIKDQIVGVKEFTVYAAITYNGQVPHISEVSANYDTINKAYKSGRNVLLRATIGEGEAAIFRLVSITDSLANFSAVIGGYVSMEVYIYEGRNPSVSQTLLAAEEYVDNSIGDVETSLENIIKKYGLGGEAQ